MEMELALFLSKHACINVGINQCIRVTRACNSLVKVLMLLMVLVEVSLSAN